MRRCGYRVNIRLQTGAGVPARITGSGPAVEGEILRGYMKRDAVVFQANTRGAIYGVFHFFLLDFPRPPELVNAARVTALYGHAADSYNALVNQRLRVLFGLLDGSPHGIR